MARGDDAAPATRPLTSETVVADHAGHARRNPNALTATLLRYRSVAARDILAHMATDGRRTAAEVVSDARSGTLGAIADDMNPEFLGYLAMVLALQGPRPEPEAGMDLFAALAEVAGLRRLRPRDAVIYLQLLAKDRQRDAVLKLLDGVDVDPATRRALATDTINPFLHPGVVSDEAAWLRELVGCFELPGSLSLHGAGTTPFDRLDATASTRVGGAQKITVVTSAYNPDAALVNAARSMVAQSWQNWEMLVVDDASTDPASRRFLDEAQALDPRVRVIRKAVNGGTYRARNTAMMQAQGDFVTFLDSDDWAHPDRLLAGVTPMLESPAVVATRSQGARVTEDLEVTRPGYRTLVPIAASLMFRVSPVVQRVGFFEPVRKGADTEYSKRIEAAFGRQVLDVGDGALTVVRLGNTLSGDEFSFAWRHPVRWTYKLNYMERHREIAAGRRSPFVEPDLPVSNYGIARWTKPVDPEYVGRRHLDVVIAGDWRKLGGPQISMLEEIEALLEQGLSVGVMHLEALRFYSGRDQALCEPVQEQLRAGRVELVQLDGDADIDLLMLRYPPILQFPPVATTAVRPQRLLVVANQAPSETDGSDQRYVPLDVHRNAAELFGTEPRWVPQSPRIRAILEPLLPREALAPWDDPAIIDVDAWRTERPRPAARPVIGRFSRDDVIKFPRTAEDLLQAYGFSSDVDVRMMGATSQVKRLMTAAGRTAADVPANWTVLAHQAMDVKDFLVDVDVVVYIDNPDANEAFGRSLLESAASGALVVASPKHEITFGDALLYAEPAEVVPLVESLLADPEAFAEQVARSQARVREQWGREAFVRKVMAELDGIRPEQQPATAPAPQGVVRLSRTSGAVDVAASGTLRAHTTPVRRFADATGCDVLAIIHTSQDDVWAQDAARRVAAQHRPGFPAAPVESVPDGVLGTVWLQDGEWAPFLGPGLVADVDATSCGVSVRTAAPATADE